MCETSLKLEMELQRNSAEAAEQIISMLVGQTISIKAGSSLSQRIRARIRTISHDLDRSYSTKTNGDNLEITRNEDEESDGLIPQSND